MSNETDATPKLFRIDEAYGNVYMWDTTAMAYNWKGMSMSQLWDGTRSNKG